MNQTSEFGEIRKQFLDTGAQKDLNTSEKINFEGTNKILSDLPVSKYLLEKEFSDSIGETIKVIVAIPEEYLIKLIRYGFLVNKGYHSRYYQTHSSDKYTKDLILNIPEKYKGVENLGYYSFFCLHSKMVSEYPPIRLNYSDVFCKSYKREDKKSDFDDYLLVAYNEVLLVAEIPINQGIFFDGTEPVNTSGILRFPFNLYYILPFITMGQVRDIYVRGICGKHHNKNRSWMSLITGDKKYGSGHGYIDDPNILQEADEATYNYISYLKSTYPNTLGCLNREDCKL